MLRCIKTSCLSPRLVGHPAIRSYSQSHSPFTKSFIFLSFPVTQIRFLDHDARVDSPTQFGLVGKAHADKEQTSFLEGVLRPIDHLPVDARVLVAGHNFPRRLLSN